MHDVAGIGHVLAVVQHDVADFVGDDPGQAGLTHALADPGSPGNRLIKSLEVAEREFTVVRGVDEKDAGSSFDEVFGEQVLRSHTKPGSDTFGILKNTWFERNIALLVDAGDARHGLIDGAPVAYRAKHVHVYRKACRGCRGCGSAWLLRRHVVGRCSGC